mmetsp:Transcript_3595/g.11048  ORF Transcript_3595/g.11048 Transcript_3595/m.11048 type:complete len:159 (-) Transcript_3595:2115-2591(-)
MELSEAKALVKDMLAAFDADANRERLAEAILAAKDNPDAIVLDATPVAIDIASEAFLRAGMEPGADTFVKVMTALARLAPTDEGLSYDVYALKQKFLPYPPAETGARKTNRRLDKVKNAVNFARLTAAKAGLSPSKAKQQDPPAKRRTPSRQKNKTTR